MVGAGVSGLLVARELSEAGRDVTVIERGGLKAHVAQRRSGSHELAIPGAAHNNETAPGSRRFEWAYKYGVGGSTLGWRGIASRMLPSDFELHSRFGVGRDWPISYDDLAPFYGEAERSLGVAGAGSAFFPGSGKQVQPPHPYAPVDRLIRPFLEPYIPLAQARPTRSIGGRPACCGSAVCELCPVDARYSALHTFLDEGLGHRPEFRLLHGIVVARLRRTGSRITELDCLDRRGEPRTVRAGTVVLAANGLENAGILLRSGLGTSDVGRWLYDHERRIVLIRLGRSAGHGRGSSLSTGISYAYADGDWRSRRGSVIVYPYNPGRTIGTDLTRELAAGRHGRKMRDRVTERFARTLVMEMLVDDLPRRDRFVELSPLRDAFGLPKNRTRYPTDSDYAVAAIRRAVSDLVQRLRPLGARLEEVVPVAGGGHLLGTCYMGEGKGVVDSNQRDHRFDNLYITGGSSFSTYGAHPPTLTVAALAVRLGRHLTARG